MRNQGIFILIVLLILHFLLSLPIKAEEEASPLLQASMTLIEEIEAKRGAGLITEDREFLTGYIEEMSLSLKMEQEKFIQNISGITGIEADKIRQWMPETVWNNRETDKNIIEKIEAELGRNMNPTEFEHIRIAGGAKKEAVEIIQYNFSKKASVITDLSPEEIMEMLMPANI